MLPDRHIVESELLVIQCQRGDKSAFERIVQLWEQPLFYYLRRLAPSEADAWDLLQETWLKVFRALRTLRDPCTLPAFLYTTARNTAISRFRSLQSMNTAVEAAGLPEETAADDEAAFDNAQQVHHALDQLALPQREVLILYFLQDLSLNEIARVLDVPMGTIKSRLHYAKAALRKILTSGDYHAG